ncbi:MAG: hypothetical protein D6744_00570 [Planctomycetota bacterium]|nr:MAG: hypothetical protein D6744_00570 [Planctomycetota bacterium]
MILTLDGDKLNWTPAEDLTLQAIIDTVRRAAPADNIIVSVQVDGRPIIGRELEERLSQPLAGVSQVDLESAAPREVAQAALQQISEQLAAAAESHEEIAAALQQDRFAEACRGFAALLNVWRAAQTTVVECCSLMGVALEDVPVGERTLAAHLAELIARLQEARGAFEARDTVLLADLAQFELPEVTSGWRQLVGELQQRVGAAAAPTT